MASPRPGPADHGGTHHKRAAAASYRVGAAVALLALLLATAAPRGATAAGSGLPVPTWGWGRWGGGGEGPVGAVAEAVKAYPGVFATARARLALKDPGSEGSLSRTNGLFSIDVHDICPMVT